MKVVMQHVSGTAKANLERAKEEMTRVLGLRDDDLKVSVTGQRVTMEVATSPIRRVFMQRLKYVVRRLVTRWWLVPFMALLIFIIILIWVRKLHAPQEVILSLTLLGTAAIAMVQWESLSHAHKIKYRWWMIWGVLCVGLAIAYAINALRVAATPSP